MTTAEQALQSEDETNLKLAELGEVLEDLDKSSNEI